MSVYNICWMCLLISSISSVQTYPCGEPENVPHARKIFQRHHRLVQYVCEQGYSPYGTTLLSCTEGRWRGVTPVCVAPGCPPLEILRNGEKRMELNGAVVRYSCDASYELIGSQIMYCDGMRWNDSRPVCNLKADAENRNTPAPRLPPPELQASQSSISSSRVGINVVREYQEEWSQLNILQRRYQPSSNDTLPILKPPLVSPSNLGSAISDQRPKLGGVHNAVIQSPAADDRARRPLHQNTAKPDVSGELRLACPPPKRPRRGYHITKPLPLEYADEDYVYYIEYHCLPGLTMVSGDNTSYCLRSGRWSGQVPVCEDVQGCVKGFKRSMSGVCEDIDECKRDNGGCPHQCANFIGGFACKCQHGYHLPEGSRSCVDLDECSLPTRYCHHHCTNHPGSFKCSCRTGFFLLPHNNRTCLDINECLPDGRGVCEQVCVNSYGSFRCGCEGDDYELNDDGRTCALRCADGFTVVINPRDKSQTCVDVNECESDQLNDCEGVCTNTAGGFLCSCSGGRVLSSDGRGCIAPPRPPHEAGCEGCDQCPADSFLQEDPTSSDYRQCICRAGYYGNPELMIPCTDINECNDTNYGCSHTCVNTDGGAHCECPSGYKLGADGRSCTDIDECQHSPCTNAECRNSAGGYLCSCTPGFRKDLHDPNRCVENNACEALRNPINGKVLPSQICRNASRLTLGRMCLYVCDHGFILRGPTQRVCRQHGWSNEEPVCTVGQHACPALSDPPNGQVFPPKPCKTEQELSYGQVCIYTCNRGYKLAGSNRRTCGKEGWTGETPKCLPRQLCPPIIRPNNTDVFPPSCYQKWNLQWRLCIFFCRKGFTMIGNSTTRCGPGQAWVSSPPKCVRTESGSPLPYIECPPDVDIDLTNGRSHANVTILNPVSNMDIIERRSGGQTVDNSFPPGITVVRFTAYSDDRTQHASCRVQVHVKDKTAPTIRRCPGSFEVFTTDQYPNVTWDQPLFSDNVQVTSVKLSRIPPERITWGSYDVTYVAGDAAGNTAECSFTVAIKPKSSSSGCQTPPPPRRGRVTCKSWPTGLLCTSACEEGYRFPHGMTSRTYICSNGRWSPQTRIPDCV